MRRLLYILGVLGMLVLASCTASQSLTSANNYNSRVIVLDGTDTVAIGEHLRVTSWKCKDYSYGGATLVEVGFFDDPFYKDLGIVLYDGGNKGESTSYRRAGLNHRWSWGDAMGNYSIVIKPDGTGLYYDFTGVPEGESIKAREIYKCYQK